MLEAKNGRHTSGCTSHERRMYMSAIDIEYLEWQIKNVAKSENRIEDDDGSQETTDEELKRLKDIGVIDENGNLTNPAQGETK